MGSLILKWMGASSMFLIVALTTLASSISSAQAASHQAGFVRIGNQRAVYADFIRPAPGKPTVVLLNGLTYRVNSWDSFVNELRSDGVGILRYDMTGQGQTLAKFGPIRDVIPLRDQVEDLENLLVALEINEPVHLVSLSYGGAVAIPFATQRPHRVASVILMAPFVEPLKSLDSMIRLQIANTRLTFPLNPATDDELYDYFLRIMVYTTYPPAEPVVLEHPYKLEATYQLVRGSRKFLAKSYAHALPARKVHLMVARQDQYIDNSVHDVFWSQVHPEARASRIFIDGSEHKIPEAVPGFSAGWVRRIMSGDPALLRGQSYLGTVRDGKVVAL